MDNNNYDDDVMEEEDEEEKEVISRLFHEETTTAKGKRERAKMLEKYHTHTMYIYQAGRMEEQEGEA